MTKPTSNFHREFPQNWLPPQETESDKTYRGFMTQEKTEVSDLIQADDFSPSSIHKLDR